MNGSPGLSVRRRWRCRHPFSLIQPAARCGAIALFCLAGFSFAVNLPGACAGEQDQESSGPCGSETCPLMRDLGTALQWADNPRQAADLAREQGKLVFLIQVSGNFARDEFT